MTTVESMRQSQHEFYVISIMFRRRVKCSQTCKGGIKDTDNKKISKD